MRAPLPLLLSLLIAAPGCPGPGPDDDATADDDATDDGHALDVPATLPDAGVYDPYEERLVPGGFHEPPLTWSHVGGSLPAGLVLEEDGDVVGVPTEVGAFAFDVQVVDSAGRTGAGTVALTVAVDEAKLFLGVWVEQPAEICIDLELMCAPWIRIDGAGEPQAERALVPAVFHVGPDGLPDAGFDDDVLWETLDDDAVEWGWTALQDPTGDGSTLEPTDAAVGPAGLWTAGELTGRGRIELSHPEHGEGSAIGYVTPPDWCPGWGC